MNINIRNQFCNCSNSIIGSENPETKNNLINEKIYKDLVIYFINYVNSKPIKLLSLHYHK